MKYIELKNLDITIKSGELISIIGPNGSGKTVLLKMLCGRIKNNFFYIDDHNVNDLSLDYKQNNIVCVFNDNLYNTDNVIDELKYYLNILKYDNIDEKINDLINYFGLDNIINLTFNNMKTEDRIYIKLLSLLIINPSIFCVDDLFSYLSNDKMNKILNYIKERNITLLSVISNLEELIYYDKILVMNKGNKEIFDKKEVILKNENIFNQLSLNLPFIYDINNMLASYELINEEHLNDKDLVNLLWK